MGAKTVILGGCCCAAVIAIIVLMATSLHTLGPTDMGIDYNGLFMRIDETTLYKNGRHFLGPGHSFKVYKKEQQDVRFPGTTPDGFQYPALTARTLDGLKVELQVAFQYRLKEDLEEIVKLYYDWGDDYQKAYAWIARNVLRDEAARWEAYDFFYNRTKINKEMTNRLRGPLDEVAAVLAGDMQLLDVGLPGQFDTALQETELIRQAIKRSGFELEEAETIAINRLRRVEEEAAVIRNSKQTEAERIGNTLEQEKATFTAQIEAETNSYKALQDQVELTPRNLLNYIWLQSIGESGSGRIRVSKPRDVQCFADPRSCTSGPNLNGGAGSGLTYSCSVGAECRLVVPGFGLSDSDEVRLAASPDACEDWSSPGNGLNDNTQAESSASAVRKGFRVGTAAAAGTYTVCYCAWNDQVTGCQVSGAYVDAGTLDVSA